MNLVRPLLASMLLVSAAMATVVDEGFNLLWVPKEGQKLTYNMSMEGAVDEFKFGFSTDMIMKVLKVDENGDYTIETVYKNGKMTGPDGEEDMEDGDPEVLKYDKTGKEIADESKKSDDEEEEEGDPLSEIFGQVADFQAPEKPVKVGDKWSHDIEENKDLELPPAKITFEAVELEKMGEEQVIRIKSTFKQTEGSTPVTGESTFLIGTKDGILWKFESELQGLVLDPDPEVPKATAKLKMIRKS